RAVTQRTFLQSALGAFSQAPRGRERMSQVMFDLARDTESFAQRFGNLPDVRNLFHRRTDERGKAFPFRLSNDPEAAAKTSRRIHPRVVRKRSANGCERMIEREIMRDDFGERSPGRPGRRIAAANF